MAINRRDKFNAALYELLAEQGRNADDIKSILDGALSIFDAQIPACLYKADENEPVFVVRAQDRTSVAVVLDWIQRNSSFASPDKIQSAAQVLRAMQDWPEEERKQAD